MSGGQSDGVFQGPEWQPADGPQQGHRRAEQAGAEWGKLGKRISSLSPFVLNLLILNNGNDETRLIPSINGFCLRDIIRAAVFGLGF